MAIKPVYWTADYPDLINRDQLRLLDKELQISFVVEWFHRNYEDPANRTPYESAEGGYQWIWGGPYDALEEISNEFGDLLVYDVIDAAVKQIEKGGILEWAPTERPGDHDPTNPYDWGALDQDVNISASGDYSLVMALQEKAREDLKERLTHLENLITSLIQELNPIGIGHNRPPGDGQPATRAEWLQLKRSIDIIIEQTKTPKPSVSTIEEASLTLSQIALKLAKWIGKHLDTTVDAFAKGVGGTSAKSIAALGVGSATAWAFGIHPQDILNAINGTIEAITVWLHTL